MLAQRSPVVCVCTPASFRLPLSLPHLHPVDSPLCIAYFHLTACPTFSRNR
jgi:hypothetical protein